MKALSTVNWVAGAATGQARLFPLWVANQTCSRRFPADGPLVISLTTHGRRIDSVYATLESLCRGTMPAPVTLWLDADAATRPLPANLRRLVDRGLRIGVSDGTWGPHTKYRPQFRESVGTGVAVVTADDDIIYPEWWLERLVATARSRVGEIVAYRVHQVRLSDEGGDVRIAPYRTWSARKGTGPSPRCFATGVGGVYYPPEFLGEVLGQGDGFVETCPRADDVWLHVCALRAGRRVSQVDARSWSFATTPWTQTGGLSVSNTFAGRNDAQIAATYTEADIRAVTTGVRPVPVPGRLSKVTDSPAF